MAMMMMKIEQTLASAPTLSFPRNPKPSLSPNPIFKPKPQKLAPLRYSLQDQDQAQGYNQAVYPKPVEIPWKKELSNSVSLIGNVGTPVEIKQLPSGGVVAWTRLAVWKSATETSWVNLVFYDEIAHVAYEHVQKGHRISVSGRLSSDTIQNDDNAKQQTYYKIVVQQLNFVESGVSPTSYDSNNMTGGVYPGNGAMGERRSIEELWQDLFANPVEWWDNRKTKRTPNYPDFKRKDTGEALWVEGRNNPAWVQSELESFDARTD